jgi:hypothetical protein
MVRLNYWPRRPSRRYSHSSTDMVAAFILVMSVAALAQFAILQWRSMWITVAAQPLSNSFQGATGIAGTAVGADDFDYLVKTSEQLCPGPQQSNLWLNEVRIYYRALRTVQKFCAPSLAGWAKRELTACSRYAAAILDQRLNASLEFAAEARSF